ncbi:Eco57I restriction-modification methylase domain-containing protein [Halomicrobium salinisoli]|uniref:Eco57I restriction-modification methylase domain-containing protein n=1 Tax=Halomicrobium salinisoli TaxID=2878391 RepID=UPI001CF044EA|nr:N-6 DNA methylase [Halomicrobium salinisoli]
MSQATLGATPYHNSSLFSGYYLDERVSDLDEWDCDDEAADAFAELRDHWDREREHVETYNEDNLLDHWIGEVLDVLGFETMSEEPLPGSGGFVDRLLYESDESRLDAVDRKQNGNENAAFGLAAAALEAKQWGTDFTERFSEQRSYRDASHQVKYYLEHTPDDLEWGVLTDGRKWRLYGTKDYATEIYYEVDLPELLDSGSLEQFKYFYVFFRPDAFRDTGGTSFLETVWSESETAAQELGEDLQDNVFTALRVLGEGFVETNDLDIDPGDEAALAELKEQSLVLLYRLMFVLYAESRNLIHPDDPAAVADYEENFSLDQQRLEIHEEIESGSTFEDYSEFSTSIWSRLEDLFRLVDEGNEALGIPPYNGGLFDDENNEFLAEQQVADRYIAEVIYRLGTTEAEDGSFVLADYADLDTRHLGSIYEGLLEHEFRIAPEQYAAVADDGGQVWQPATEVSVADAVETVESGELYVVNDDGERKATGSYYTPDYVVSYIVEETVDPLIDEIKTDLAEDGLEPSDREYFARFWQRVLELKILDPAMGSGHFLTKATGYLTEQVMEVVREQEIQSYDEQDLRREIAKECIYGVDLNGMAVELAKLSMWLETLAADQPLAFLDHHLKTGNSLVGSDITEVLSEDTEENGGQLTLTQAFARVRQSTLEHVMDLMQELLAIDNETLDDIKSMEEIYGEIRDDPLYQRLFELANVHTAEQFGLDVPEGVYETMADAIEDEDEWAAIREEDWFRSAQATADEEDFFHWELEYPEVFFGDNGEKRGDAGFDTILENPPYLPFQEGTDQEREYYRSYYYTSHRTYDIYVLFVEKSVELLKEGGRGGFIIPNKFIKSQYGEKMREFLPENTQIESLLDFKDGDVFDGAKNYVCIPIVRKGEGTEPTKYIENNSPREAIRIARSGQWGDVPPEAMREWHLLEKDVYDVLDNISRFTDLGSLSARIFEGARPGGEKVYYEFDSEIEPDLLREYIKPKDVEPYFIQSSSRNVIFPYQQVGEDYSLVDISDYPNAHSYLNNHSDDIYGESADDFELEYGYYHVPDSIEDNRVIICPDIAKENEFALRNSENSIFPNTIYAIDINSSESNLEALVAILNSKLCELFIKSRSPSVRGGYYRYKSEYLEDIPVPRSIVLNDVGEAERVKEKIDTYITGEDVTLDLDGRYSNALSYLSKATSELRSERESLNLNLLDYLGQHSDGKTLNEVGFTQPPTDAANSVLSQTSEQKPNLCIGEAEIIRESPNTIEIRLTARYKPDPDKKGKDAYTETEPLPALRITDLTETEADLIEAFVPVAVDEAGGFANFRENATKTNSLIDRLRKLTLPAVDDVREGLESYIETTERAEELEAKIEKTDRLIDDIVYELYGLTDEEIEIVEEAVDN